MNSGGAHQKGTFTDKGRRRHDADDVRVSCVSPDRDDDLRRRFEALKGNLSPQSQVTGREKPLSLADIQGSIAKKHTSDLANAQRKWIESLTSSRPTETGPTEEEAQKEWISHLSVGKVTDRPCRRDDRQRGRSGSSEFRVSGSPPRSSSTSSQLRSPRNVTVKSAVLTPAAPSFGFCDVPRLTLNALPVTATSVKDVVKPDREIVTESGKTIRMLKLEEPPKAEKKFNKRSPRKMKTVIDLDPSKNEGRKQRKDNPRTVRTSLSPKKLRTSGSDVNVGGTLSPESVEKYKLSLGGAAVAQDAGNGRNKVGHKSPKRLKRSSSLPGGLFEEKLENEGAAKQNRTYDVKETRCFIKQKQKEREERLAEEKRRKSIEAEERKRKMEQLRDTQRKIMQKIKKRTVHKVRSQLVIDKEPEKPKWVGPLETATPSALDSSLEFTVPKPRQPTLSSAATGTITFKKPKTPKGRVESSNLEKEVISSRNEQPVKMSPPKTSVATCTRTDHSTQIESMSESLVNDFCLKDVEVSTEAPQHLKRPATQLVESGTQIDFDFEKSLSRSKSGSTSSHSYCKRPKQTVPQDMVLNKENVAANDYNPNEVYSSKLDRFLAEYVPTPKKESKSNMPQTPAWLQEMSQYPDQFNLVNTLNKAYKRQQRLESKEHVENPSKNDPKGLESCSSAQDRTVLSTRLSEMSLEAPIVRLSDGLSSSNAASTSASFELLSNTLPTPLKERNSGVGDWEDIPPLEDVSSALSLAFPPTTSGPGSAGEGSALKGRTFEILGEKFVEPKGNITERRPLKRRNVPKLLGCDLDVPTKSLEPFVTTKRGSDVHQPSSSPDVGRSRSASFSSMKEGSYVLSPSESKSDEGRIFDPLPESSYQRFVRNAQQPQSDQSSDSISEIVKVSRTVSRGSTVISEEVSEVQNILSFSKKSMKFNSSSIQNRIKNEIENLDRVSESLTSFMESGKVLRESTNSIFSSDPSHEVTMRPKSPILRRDDTDTALVAPSSVVALKNVIHSREPSGSSVDVSTGSVMGVDVSAFTVEMFDNLIKDEKIRSEKLVSGLKDRISSIQTRAKKDFELIEVQKKKLIEKGHSADETKELRRKQRGVIMKASEDIEEMNRQKAMENKACQERCMLLKQQQQLISLLLQTRRESIARASRSSLKSLQLSHMDDSVRYERGADILDRKKREYREREDALKERKKNVEAIVAWKKRLELEEKRVRDMEKLIARSSFSAPLPQTGVERGTSPFIDVKDSEPAEVKVTESRAPGGLTSQSESEHQNKDYYSDSFEHSSAMSETASAAPGSVQGSSLLNKALKMPMLKNPLLPRATIVKRRHSSGSDESMLLSQNDTLSEPSDVEVRVSALEQQLRHRKSELAKLKREYQKNQKERLRSAEKNLISQIQLYDSYIEQVKSEIKELETSDVKVTKPQIKQPKFSDRRQSDKFIPKSKFKDATDSKNSEITVASEELSSHEGSVLFLERFEEKEITKKAESVVEENNEVLELVASDLVNLTCLSNVEMNKVSTDSTLKATLDKVKMKATEPSRDSESSVSEKDFSIEEIIEKAESKTYSSEDIYTQSNVLTVDSLSDIADQHKLSVVEEVSSESAATQSQISEVLSLVEEPSKSDTLNTLEETSLNVQEASRDATETEHPEVKLYSGSDSIQIDQKIVDFKQSDSDGSKLVVDDVVTETSNDTVINTVSESAHKLSHLSAAQAPTELSISEKLSVEVESNVTSVVERSPDSPVLPVRVESAASSPNEPISDLATTISDGISAARSESGHVSEVIEEVASQEASKLESQQSTSVREFTVETENIVATGSETVSGSAIVTASVDGEYVSSEKQNESSSGQKTTKSARKRLDMDVSESVADGRSASEYVPTMKPEGGVRSVSELIASVEKGDSSVMEQVPSDLTGSATEEMTPVNESDSEVAAEESAVVEDEASEAKDDSLDKLDFSLGSLDPYRPVNRVVSPTSGANSEAGDNISVAQLAEYFEDKQQLGQGDELGGAFDMEADSLEDPFGADFNSPSNAGDFDKTQELSPVKPLDSSTVMQLLQSSIEISDKIWEQNLEDIKKMSGDTPLLTALQRERQQNVNVDSISQLIFDSFVDDATSLAMKAYNKKKQSLAVMSANAEDGGSSLNKVGDNEKFWLGEDFTLQAAHEAEQLRLQQLQIEQEIEQLEQAQEVPYYYVREIPNKPPPPYTPPKPAPPTKEETVSRVLSGGEILWDIEMSGGDPSEAALPPDFLPNLQDESYRMFLFDLAKELYLKIKPRPAAPAPPWVVTKRRGRPLPPIRCKEDLLTILEKETKLAFGFEPRILRESLIMKWTRKRRDHVDEILVRELQESEPDWRDFTVEENAIKNRIAESLIADALDDAAAALSSAFTNKFKSLTVDQS